MKIIPKIIIFLTRINEGKISTLLGNYPKNIYCHKDSKGSVVGLLFINENERYKYTDSVTIQLESKGEK